MTQPWYDGGYHAGQRITTTDGLPCVLLTSLGTLGWVAQEEQTGKKILLLFGAEDAREAPAGEGP